MTLRISGRSRTMLACLLLAGVLGVSGAGVILVHRATGTSASGHRTASADQQIAPKASSSNAPDSSSATATTNGQPAGTAAPDNAACALLTPMIARQMIDTNATYAPATDSSTPQTSDTSLSTCGYASGEATIQLSVRAAKNSLGASENATAFGSERPASATPVSGYGQSAYWDPDVHTLNILGSNTWYIVRSSSGTQQRAEAVATACKATF